MNNGLRPRGVSMAKFALLPVLLAAGCLISGVYGALHDQISYTVSPEYFHAFKFRQFAIPPELQNRLGASIVGWEASWWMGVVIGVPVLLVGLIVPGWKPYLRHGLIAFVVVAVTAMLIGLSGLIYAYFTVTEASVANYFLPFPVADRVAFFRVGTMHDFSYLGGVIGIVTACIYLAFARYRMKRRSLSPTHVGSAA